MAAPSPVHLSENAYQDMLAKVLANHGDSEVPQHPRGWSWKVLESNPNKRIGDETRKSNKDRTSFSW